MHRTIAPVVSDPAYHGGDALSKLGGSIIQTRVDSKNESGKLQKDVVDKFVGDIAKNPMSTGHLLAGGDDLTGPARLAFIRYSTILAEEGKVLMYISNPAIAKLEGRFSESKPKDSLTEAATLADTSEKAE